jgi:two-component system phosphate regulon sensor histidine kinase PhoR
MAAQDRDVNGARQPIRGLRHGGLWLVAATSLLALIVLVTFAAVPFGYGIAAAVFIFASVFLAGALADRGLVEREEPSVLASPNHEPFDAIIGALVDPAILLDREARVVSFNARAAAIAPALRRGEPASLALRLPELVEAMRRASQSGLSERIEFSERIPAERWFEAYVQPVAHIEGTDSRQPYLLLSFHDLTPVRRAEEMRADFVANASHELRTPLAALSGFIETLRGAAREDPAARERFLAIMEAQARRMARLIDDLLSLSRIELNAHLRPEAPVELLPVVRQVVDTLQTLAQDRGVEITIAAPEQSLVVAGDRDELIRVFENLVENALKYGGAGKRVEITLGSANTNGGREAVVAVRDFGPGIAAEHLPRLTERFYRVDVAGSRAQGGTGLGLALVKHILNRHRGRLSIESKAGAGATFTVRMPLLQSAEN